MQPLELLTTFITPLEKSKIPYFVTGSIASIFYGEPRLTHDIDVVIHLSQNEISKLISFFPLEQYYCPPQEVILIETRRRPFGHFNLIHHESGLKADIYTDAEDPFHEWAFKNRKRVNLGKNIELWLAPPEYVIVRKLEYHREGGSEKHLEDIKKMLPLIQEYMDLKFLEEQIKARSLTSYWLRIHAGKSHS